MENLQEEEERLTPLAEENESLAAMIEAKNIEITDMKNTLKEKEAELCELKKTVEEKELQFKKALATAKKLKFQLQKVKEKEGKDEEEGHVEDKEITRLKEHVQKVDSELADHKLMLEQKMSELEILTSQLSTKETLCSELEQTLAGLSESSCLLEGDKSTLKKQLFELNQQYSVLLEKQQVVVESDDQRQAEMEELVSKLSNLGKCLEEKESYVKEMEERVQSFEELIQSLQQEVRKQTTSVNQLQNEVKQGRIEKGQLEEEKQSLQKNIEQMSSKIVDLSNQLAFHEENLSQFAHSIKILSPNLHHVDFQNLNQVSEIVKDIIGTAEQNIYVLKQELEEKEHSSKGNTEREVQELRDNYEIKLSNQMEENQSLQNKLSQLTSQYEEMQKKYKSKLSNHTEEKQLLQSQLNQITEMQTAMESKIVEQNRENESLQNQIAELTAQFTDLETLKAENLSLKEDITQLNEERSHIVSEKDMLMTKTAELEQTRVEVSQETENLKLNIQTLTQEREELRLFIDKILHEKQDLELSVHMATSKNEDLDLKFNEIQQQSNELESKIKELQCENLSLISKIDSYKDQFESTQLAMEEMNTKLIESEKERKDMESKYNGLSEEKMQLEMQYNVLISEKEMTVTAETEQSSQVPDLGWGDVIEKVEVEPLRRSAQEHADTQTLKDEVEVLKGQIKSLADNVKSSESKCEKMLTKLKAFKSKNQALQAELDEVKERLLQTNENMECGKRKDSALIETLKEEKHNIDEELQNFKTERDSLLHSLETERMKCEKLNLQVIDNEGRYKSQMEVLLRQIEAESSELTQLKSHGLKMNDDYNALTEENNKLSDALTQVMKEKEASHVEMEVLRSENEMLVNKKYEYERQVKENQSLCDELEAECKSYREIVANLKHALNREKEDNFRKTKQLQSDSGDVSELTRKITELESERSQLIELKNRISDFELERNQMADKIVELENEREQMIEEMDGLRDDLINERKDSKEKLEKLKVEILNKGEDNVEALKSELEKLRTLCKEQRDEREGLDWKLQEMSALEEEIEELRLELEKARREQKNLVSDEGVKKLKDDLDHTKAALKRKESECEKLKSQSPVGDSSERLTELEEQLQLINEELNEVMSENERLKSSPSAMKAQMYETLQNQFTELAEKYSDALQENEKLKTTSVEESDGKLKDDSRVKELEDQLQLINEEINDLMLENQKLKQVTGQNDMKLKLFDKLQNEYDELHRRIETMEKENDTLKTQIAENTRHTVDSSEVDGLREQLDIINEELNELMSENERLRSRSSPQEMKVKMFDTLQKEFQEIGGKYSEAVKNIENLKQELEQKNKDLESLRSESLVKTVAQVEENVKREQVRPVGQSPSGGPKENEHLKNENEKFKRIIQDKNEMFEKLQKDLNSMNVEYNKLINDNSNMAKQIEELHQKLLQQGESQKDVSIIIEERDHFEREKERLIKHILDLEKQLEAQSDQSVQVNQELLRVEGELQQLVFDKNSLQSQLNLSTKDGKQTSRFQADYDQLQKQFTVAMGQKNQAQAENNQLNHRLQQRETRCQQLARQVTQLAEDRSYLNKQLGNFSQALRIREQELGTLQQQYRVLYQSHNDLQSKLMAAERQFATEAIQKASSADLTEVKVQNGTEVKSQKDKPVQQTSEDMRMENKEFEARLADFTRVRMQLTETNERLEKTLMMEREQRIQTEEALAAVQARLRSIEAGEEFKLDMDEDDDRIRLESPMLLRDEAGYCCRMMRWIRIQKEYYCISGRQITRLMRQRPGIRTMIWTYFIFLHLFMVACLFGFI